MLFSGTGKFFLTFNFPIDHTVKYQNLMFEIVIPGDYHISIFSDCFYNQLSTSVDNYFYGFFN